MKLNLREVLIRLSQLEKKFNDETTTITEKYALLNLLNEEALAINTFIKNNIGSFKDMVLSDLKESTYLSDKKIEEKNSDVKNEEVNNSSDKNATEK